MKKSPEHSNLIRIQTPHYVTRFVLFLCVYLAKTNEQTQPFQASESDSISLF